MKTVRAVLGVFALLAVSVLAFRTVPLHGAVPPGYLNDKEHYYSGGPIVMGFTEDPDTKDDQAMTKTYRNLTGERICDFVVGKAPGQGGTVGLKAIQVEVWRKGGSSSTKGQNFHFDDNGDGDVADNEEDDADDDDGTYGDIGRSIAEPHQQQIQSGEYFRITVTKADGPSMNLQWQATAKGRDEQGHPVDGLGGPLLAMFMALPPGTGSPVSIPNGLGVLSVSQRALNAGDVTIHSISFETPTGVTVESVTSETHPGYFDPATETFTFTSGVPKGSYYEFTFTLDALAEGDETVVEWTAN